MTCEDCSLLENCRATHEAFASGNQEAINLRKSVEWRYFLKRDEPPQCDRWTDDLVRKGLLPPPRKISAIDER